MINRVNANVLFVENLERAVQFYRDQLGLTVAVSDEVSCAFHMEDQDFALVHISAGAEMLNEEVLGTEQGVSRRVMLCVDVNDVESTYKTLKSKDVTFIKGPVDQTWGYRTAYFADPEGNIWELRQSIPRGKDEGFVNAG